jgi:hypothetical protein
VTTAFCYGCNPGPTQTAAALQTFDQRQIAWIDQHHITEEKLDAAITTMIDAYNRFCCRIGGEGLIASNNRGIQRNRIKYSHLIANCLIFHNVHAQTHVLQ